MNIFRQGDVLLIALGATEQLPADAKLVPREHGGVVLAHGEVTGHAHQMRARTGVHLLQPKGKPERYLKVVGGTKALTHEEHKTIEVPAGDYRVLIQTEYTPTELRQVAD